MDVPLFAKGVNVQDLEDGQNRERPVMIRRQNQRNGKRREDGQVQRFAGQGDQRHCLRVPKTDCCRDFVIRDKQEQAMQEQLQCTMNDLELARLELAKAHERIHMLECAKDQLSKFVPRSVRLMAETDSDAIGLQKVEQEATVLFLDIGGYSNLCESLNHQRVNFLVEKYFSEFLDEIQKVKGEINETSGDGLMIIFQDIEEVSHARAAASTAIGIYYKTLKVNAELRGKYEPTVVNMGLNSGRVFLGATKFEGVSGARWTFTASGLTTVLAARIAGIATDGKILLGPETAKRLQGEYLVETIGDYHLKNITKPVSIYQPIA